MAEKEPVTADVFLETDAFIEQDTDEALARETFTEEHGSKVKADTVTCIGKRHDVGHGITYTFSADAK